MPSLELQTQLRNIANIAYGSGRYEKTKGGEGNIALISGHVVKFNTHFGAKGGPVTDEMKRGCDSLRRELERLAIGLLRDSDVTLKDFRKEIASVRTKLGLSPDGRAVVARKLLDRKSVADVIRQIDARTGQDSFKDAPTKSVSTRPVDTGFTAAMAEVRARECMMSSEYVQQPIIKDEVLDEMIARGAEKGIADVHKQFVEALAKKVLTKGGKAKPSATDEKLFDEFGKRLVKANDEYGQVARLTVGQLKEKLNNPQSGADSGIDGLLLSFSWLSTTCQTLFARSGGKEIRLADLANSYTARKLELAALVAELRAGAGLVEGNPGDDTTVGARLVERVVGREDTHALLENLRGRLTGLGQDLAEIKNNVEKGTSVLDKTARLKRFEIDLNVASEALRNLMSDERERQMDPGKGQIGLTVLLGIEREVDSMRKAILEIRGATVRELGAQVVKDHCPEFSLIFYPLAPDRAI